MLRKSLFLQCHTCYGQCLSSSCLSCSLTCQYAQYCIYRYQSYLNPQTICQVGLAVGDIQAIQDEAELQKLALQVIRIFIIESVHIQQTQVVKRTLFHKCILHSWFFYLLLSICAQKSTIACCNTEQVLAHYLLINQFSATAIFRHQKTSLGLPWPRHHVSNDRI